MHSGYRDFCGTNCTRRAQSRTDGFDTRDGAPDLLRPPPDGRRPRGSRGALLRTPVPPRAPGAALPAQGRTGETPPTAGADSSGAFEHSQPGAEQAAEPDTHRPRPTSDGVPAQPGGAQTGAGTVPGAVPGSGTPAGAERRGAPLEPDRRTGQPTTPGQPTPMRRDGDRLRFVGAATRRIARGMDLDEIVMGLCRATVPTFADAILVYLREPLPVGDERPTGPLVLRLRRTDRIPAERDTESGFTPRPSPSPPSWTRSAPNCARCGRAARSPRCCAGCDRSSRTRPPPAPPCPNCSATGGISPYPTAGGRSSRRCAAGAGDRGSPVPARPGARRLRGRRPAGRRPARHAQRPRHRQGGAVRA